MFITFYSYAYLFAQNTNVPQSILSSVAVIICGMNPINDL